MDLPLINPFDFHSRFPHITEKVIEKLDDTTLKNCRQVAKSWQNYIDDTNVPWIRIVNIPSIPQNGETYFQIAAKAGQSKITKMIIQDSKELDLDLNDGWNDGNTAFQLACLNGHLKVAENIVQESANFNINLNTGKFLDEGNEGHENTGFQLACKFGHLKLAEMLLENSVNFDIDIHAMNANGQTAFHLACSDTYHSVNESSKLLVAKLIIEKSAELDINLNAKNYFGKQTALHCACIGWYTDIVKLIITKSIDFDINLNAKDENGRTALHDVSKWGRECPNIVEIFIKNSVKFGIKLDAKDKEGLTTFHLACIGKSNVLLKI